MAHKIKEINKKFNKIAKRKNDLGLQTIDVGSSSSYRMKMNRETYSLVAANWKIVGRGYDKLKIINTLLDKDSCLVFSVVGMGGVGKTTLAQLVYNDMAITKHFQLKIWICVSVPFDVKKLLKNIVNSIGTGKTYDDETTMDDIVLGLQDAFREKKFLLVLDDVWNENPDDWYKFKTPFMVGAKGSKILITTRSMDVASIMIDKFMPYQLGILDNYDCWLLFKEITFGSVAGPIESPKLVEIGKEMVKTCGGLPFAVIFLGNLMRSKKKEEEWENIQDTKIWHESYEGKNSKHSILPSLKLSYDYLPSHLKQCFSYCCLFPKDWKIQRETLVRFWMAQGFLIKSPGINAMSMEEIGNEYFNNLLRNFFFQDVVRNKDGDIVTCKMHDIVHDLARSIIGKNECIIVENAHDIDCISEATFHLNLVNVDEGLLPKVFEALKHAKNLRTVLFNSEMSSTQFDIVKAINKNKRLRVLSSQKKERRWSYDVQEYRDYHNRNHSTSSIGELKHLRYLNLAETPKGIGRLRFLQTLNEFNVGNKKNDQNAWGIEELEFLNHLTGDLTIYHLKNVTSGTSACIANLKKKKKLRGLKLFWDTEYSYYYYGDEPPINNDHESVLKGLRPHPNLTTLCIKGANLPRWTQEEEEDDSSSTTNYCCLPNLVVLILSKCNYIMDIDVFGTLPSLKKLTLYSLSSLQEWVVPPSALKKLQELEIKLCTSLTTITPPTTIFPSLKVLGLEFVDERATETLVTNNLISLTSLTLYYIHNLISLPRQGLIENNNTLLSLEIKSCDKFEGFFPPNKDKDEDDQLQISQVVSSTTSSSSSSLQSLTLYDCPHLEFFPNIHSLTSLRGLVIRNCKEKESRSFLDEYIKIMKRRTATTAEEV